MKGDSSCTLCKRHTGAQSVCILGDGTYPNKNMIIGEAPSRVDDEHGYLHVSRKLQEILVDLKLDIQDFFYTNAVACYGEKAPTKAQIRSCGKWLEYQMKLVKPKVVLLSGNAALQAITGKPGIASARGRPFEKEGIIYVPTLSVGSIFHEPDNYNVILGDIDLFNTIAESGEIPRETELDHTIVTNRQEFLELKRSISKDTSLDIETNNLYPWREEGFTKTKAGKIKPHDRAKIISIGFGTANGEFEIPVNHPESMWTEDEVLDMLIELEKVFILRKVNLVAQNGKFDFLWLLVHFGLEWYNFMGDDTMLAHYILDENSRHDLKLLSRKLLGAPDYNVDLNTKTGAGSLDKHCLYLAHDVYYTRKLKYKFRNQINKDDGLKGVYENVLMAAARLFVEIEFDGIVVDTEKFDAAEGFLEKELEAALKDLRKFEPSSWKHDSKGKLIPFNWGSPKQLGELLFDILKLPVVERTKTGNPSCSESALKRTDHELIRALLRYRGAKQQMSFFIDGWKPYIHRKRMNGKWVSILHPSFKLHGTVTGRLSAEHPNLQQVPRDKRIRSLITAEEGWTLVECDLSQIELRIVAELAHERKMLYAFLNNIDLHWQTAIREIERGGAEAELVLDTGRTWKQDKTLSYSECIDALIEMGPDQAKEIRSEWGELRKKAKAVNFGFVYGMWWKKFKLYARDNYGVTVSDSQARSAREFFFAEYSDLPDWHNKIRRIARSQGSVRSLSGRIRRVPKATGGKNTPERQEAERQAINSPVQGFASDINLMAAIQLRKEFPRSVAKICGTVHDAILVRVRNDHVSLVTRRLLKIMEHPDLFDELGINLAVPIEAEAKVGPWGMGVSLDKWLIKNPGIVQCVNVKHHAGGTVQSVRTK